MEKVGQHFFGGKYNSYYKLDMDIYELSNLIADSDVNISFVDVDEGVERDMKLVSGQYSLNSFIQKYDYITSGAYDSSNLSINYVGKKDGSKFIISTSTKPETLVVLSSTNENLDLNSMLQKKSDNLGHGMRL